MSVSVPGRRSAQANEEVPDGEVRITPHGEGWYLVEIGRGRYVKRFNLRDSEARQLADLIAATLPT